MSKHHYTSVYNEIRRQPQLLLISGAVFLGMIILGCLILAIWPKTFTARATIEFQKPMEGGVSSVNFASKEFFNTQKDVIESRNFQKRLANSPEFGLIWEGAIVGASQPLRENLRVRHRPSTNLLDIFYTSRNYSQATDIAEAAATVYLGYWKEIQGNRYDEILESMEGQANEKAVADLQMERARVLSAAQISEKPSAASMQRHPRFWGGFGLIVGCAFVTAVIVGILISRNKIPISTINDIADAVDPPNLALLSKSTKDNHRRQGAPETFTGIKDMILGRYPEPKGVTMVFVSCMEGEEPAPVTAEMATMLAGAGHSVLLVEGNLREPVIQSHFDVPLTPGVTDYLTGKPDLQNATAYTKVPNLWVMPGGNPPRNPSQLLSSLRMGELIHDAKSRFDFVIFNGGALLTAVDSLILVGEADMTFLATEAGNAPGDMLARTRHAIEQAGGSFSGLILTEVEPKEIEEVHKTAPVSVTAK